MQEQMSPEQMAMIDQMAQQRQEPQPNPEQIHQELANKSKFMKMAHKVKETEADAMVAASKAEAEKFKMMSQAPQMQQEVQQNQLI